MEEDLGGAIITMKAKDQRGKAMEEEAQGREPLLPSLPVAPEHRWGHHHHRNLHQQLHRPHHQLFPPLRSGVTSLLPAVKSLLKHGAQRYILFPNDVWLSYDV